MPNIDDWLTEVEPKECLICHYYVLNFTSLDKKICIAGGCRFKK
jgi:hypothetical protein